MAHLMGVLLVLLLMRPAMWQMCNAFSWNRPSNIIILMTDDQDTHGIIPMEKTWRLIAKKGAVFKNSVRMGGIYDKHCECNSTSFVNTPLCCPSRATFLTGLYQHNHKVSNNSLSGNCNSREWQNLHESQTFASFLKKAHYRTFYAGKYLNQYGSPQAGGSRHVPHGWDWWIGLKGNSKYFNYTLSVNGTARRFRRKYLTDHIGQYALEFLRGQSSAPSAPPFLMVLAPPAPHAPYTPAPRHARCYPNASVPRTPNFNPVSQDDKHWLVRQPPWPLPDEVLERVDEAWRLRRCTLLAVDELLEDVVQAVQRLGRLRETYIVVTSDNGYHLGHYGLPWDKRQPYDTDVRVPLLVRGPGVVRRDVRSAVVTADLAPTVLDMAGLPAPPHMDGRSFLPLLHARKERPKPAGRSFLVEHVGEGNGKSVSPDCPWNEDSGLDNCEVDAACKCQDAVNNTFSCVRTISPLQDFTFCQFHDQEQFIEAYDNLKDPYQMDNIHTQMGEYCINTLSKALGTLRACSSSSCNSVEVLV